MADIQSLFTKLAASYLESVPEKLNRLRTLISESTHRHSAIVELAELAHQLAGSAGTFALPTLGEQARELLEEVRKVQGEDRLLHADEHDAFHVLVDMMETTTPRPVR